jgi:truncated hemoglobin YjbI
VVVAALFNPLRGALVMSQAVAAVDKETLTLVQSRFGYCCVQPTFFDDFYKDFVSQSAEIRTLFKNTDMTKQKAALRQGVAFLIMYAGGNALAEGKIRELTRTHNRDGYAIRADQYQTWLNAFLRTVKKHDPKFEAKHDVAWRAVLTQGIEAMKAGF